MTQLCVSTNQDKQKSAIFFIFKSQRGRAAAKISREGTKTPGKNYVSSRLRGEVILAPKWQVLSIQGLPLLIV